MIRSANQEDLQRIMEIVAASVEVMNEQGNYQWDHTYPTVANYQTDLDNEELYVYQQDDAILGVVAISEKPHSEYPLIRWSYPDHALTVKRLAVDPAARGKSIADNFFQFAELVAKEKGIHYLKTDTFSKNIYAQQLFLRNGYRFVEERKHDGDRDSLYYYEKVCT
ncbi:GNAT family N-acetyltransferase [Aquibacillus sediminis]|uniref:GNAT family N-acetyltransferase n=1 Tax=Aquibacillus sediminis TaxID=2574734 RepID=UPI001107AFDE|nr:GNAT family N-acetyltransferase [Aquibacillus sediminis]